MGADKEKEKEKEVVKRNLHWVLQGWGVFQWIVIVACACLALIWIIPPARDRLGLGQEWYVGLFALLGAVVVGASKELAGSISNLLTKIENAQDDIAQSTTETKNAISNRAKEDARVIEQLEQAVRTNSATLEELNRAANIDKNVVRGTDTIYEEVKKDLKAHGRQRVEIDVLGYTLFSVPTRLQGWLEEGLLTNMRIRLHCLDSGFIESSDAFNPSWAHDSRKYPAEVVLFKEANAAALEQNDVTIEILRYRHIPAVHGFRIGGGVLYIAVARWTHGRIADADHSYFHRVQLGDRSRFARSLRDLFANWVDAAQSYGGNDGGHARRSTRPPRGQKGLVGVVDLSRPADIIADLGEGDELLWLETFSDAKIRLAGVLEQAVGRGVRIRVLALGAGAATVSFRVAELTSPRLEVSSVVNDIRDFERAVSGIQPSTSKGQIELRLYDDLPCVPMYLKRRADGTREAVTGYFLSKPSDSLPHLHWVDDEQGMVDLFFEYFEDKWRRNEPARTDTSSNDVKSA